MPPARTRKPADWTRVVQNRDCETSASLSLCELPLGWVLNEGVTSIQRSLGTTSKDEIRAANAEPWRKKEELKSNYPAIAEFGSPPGYHAGGNNPYFDVPPSAHWWSQVLVSWHSFR